MPGMFRLIRHIQPGYPEGRIPNAKIDKILCDFAALRYSGYLVQKWGVHDCAQYNPDLIMIRRNLLALDLIYDPELCTPDTSCTAPCGVSVRLIVYGAAGCGKPFAVSARIIQIPVDCQPPSAVSARIIYA